jgi:hypothetical protein
MGKNDGKILLTQLVVEFGRMGKRIDAHSEVLKPNGKIQKESDGDGVMPASGRRAKVFDDKWPIAVRVSTKSLSLVNTWKLAWPMPAKSALKRGNCSWMARTRCNQEIRKAAALLAEKEQAHTSVQMILGTCEADNRYSLASDMD